MITSNKGKYFPKAPASKENGVTNLAKPQQEADWITAKKFLKGKRGPD